MWTDIVNNAGKAKANALASGNNTEVKAPKKAESSDEDWMHGECREFWFSEPKQVRYQKIVDKNGIEKCVRDDGRVGILVGHNSTYVSDYFTSRIKKEEIRKRNILLFSPKIVDCLLHPGSSDYEKAVMLYQAFLKYYPDMIRKPSEFTEHFGQLLPHGLISQELVKYEEGSEIREYEKKSDYGRLKWTFKLNVRIEWLPIGKRFKIIDFEGDVLITDDDFQTA